MFYRLRSTRQILLEGTGFYLKHWACLTRPLIYPLLAQFLGLALWLTLTYGIVDWMTGSFPGLNLWLLWTGFILANIPGMFLFFDGFWRYLVWVSAQNLMVRELVETGLCEETHPYYVRIRHRSVDYTLLWTFFFGLLFIPLGLGMIPISFFSSQPEAWGLGLMIGGVIAGVGLLISLVLMLFFSVVFQVFAFTPGSAGASLFRSLDLVSQNIWKTLAIVVVALVATQVLIPFVLTDLCDALQMTPILSYPVQLALEYLIREYYPSVQALHDPVLSSVFSTISSHKVSFAQNITQAILLMSLSALLLPLGNCWFALLYADLKTRMEQSRHAIEPVEKLEAVA